MAKPAVVLATFLALLQLLSTGIVTGVAVAQTPEPSPLSSPNPLPDSSTSSPTPAGDPPPPTPLPAKSSSPPSTKPDPNSITDDQITQLVKALIKIRPLVIKTSQSLQSVQDEAQRSQLINSFETEATKIVQAEGLTPEQYRQWITLANENPNFKARVSKKLDELSPRPQSSSQPSAPTATDKPSQPTPSPTSSPQ